MKTTRLTVRGMHCRSCENSVEEALGGIDGIHSSRADAARDRVTLTHSADGIPMDAVKAAVEQAGYRLEENVGPDGFRIRQLLLILGVIAALAIFADRSGVLNRIPVVGAGMSYGVILLVGVLTSVHCVGMCGGICLSQSLAANPGAAKFRAPILYNLGRLISYTSVGFLAGALGSVIAPGLRVQGFIILAAGVFMAVFGLKTAGLIRFRIPLPGISGSRLAGKGPLVVGFLNGFLPCGPLQAVQLYALGSGSPVRGALAMALFCLGTMPVMFSFGSVGNLLSIRFRKRAMQVGALVILVMAAGMTSRGWALAGLPGLAGGVTRGGSAPEGITLAAIGTDGVQRITTGMTSSSYQPFIIQAGVPLEWTLIAGSEDLNGCNNPITIPSLGITRTLIEGENRIALPPGIVGRIGFTCWMGMIDSAIFVVDNLDAVDGTVLREAGDTASAPTTGGCSAGCCSIEPPA